jgi:hypothetical protein
MKKIIACLFTLGYSFSVFAFAGGDPLPAKCIIRNNCGTNVVVHYSDDQGGIDNLVTIAPSTETIIYPVGAIAIGPDAFVTFDTSAAGTVSGYDIMLAGPTTYYGGEEVPRLIPHLLVKDVTGPYAAGFGIGLLFFGCGWKLRLARKIGEVA